MNSIPTEEALHFAFDEDVNARELPTPESCSSRTPPEEPPANQPVVEDEGEIALEYQLHYWARNDSLDFVKFFVRNGYDIDERDDNDETALYLAFQNKHADVANYLIKNDADTATCISEESDLLHGAAEEGNVRIARMLLRIGAQIDALMMKMSLH